MAGHYYSIIVDLQAEKSSSNDHVVGKLYCDFRG